MVRSIIAISVIALLSCHRSPTEPGALELRAGNWAGPQVELTVSESQVVFVATTCLRGSFARPTIASDGTFAAEGTLEPMAGPPPPPPFPHARINGAVFGNSLVFTATNDRGAVVGPFTATYLAASPTFYPCPV